MSSNDFIANKLLIIYILRKTHKECITYYNGRTQYQICFTNHQPFICHSWLQLNSEKTEDY